MNKVNDTKINLCDTCSNRCNFPLCMPQELEFGDGIGNDNIIKCERYKEGYKNIVYYTKQERR